jgi:hypothetical protein
MEIPTMTRRTPHRFSFLIQAASVASALAMASTMAAQTPNWFPLEIGNSWLYRPAPANRPSSQESRSISVHGKESAGGREYFQVSYFGREVLLRDISSDGSIVAYDRASNSEQPWLSLGLPVGSTFPTSISQCTTTGAIAARDAAVTVPAGTFNNVVHVRYQGSCADAGVTQQFFAPNVGLVTTEETSFAGPVKFELTYYRVGSATGGVPEVAFTVALDAPRYPQGSTLQARLTLRSTSPDPIRLHFPSGQSFDLRIYDEKGTVGDIWSKDKLFVMIIRDEIFGPGEKTYAVTMPLPNLPPGRYIAEGYLTTDPLLYLGRVSFEIVSPQDIQPGGKPTADVVK